MPPPGPSIVGDVARQPILDRSDKIFGYELLCRGASDDAIDAIDADVSAARALCESVLSIGRDTLTAGLPTFVKLTRHLLVNDTGTLLSPADTVLELSGDIAVDDEVTAACHGLRSLGYALALDDFVVGSGAEALLPLATFVKIDALAIAPESWGTLLKRLPADVRVIAKNVHTLRAANQARVGGVALFQGYFFCKPKTMAVKKLPARRLVYLHLVQALGREDLSLAKLEDIIKHDVSLTVQVLRTVNSAAFGLRFEIDSIQQALLFLGLDQLRKWATVWVLAGINNSASETMVVALLRARSCEIVGEAMWSTREMSGFFLLGLCSLLDAMLGQPMPQALSNLSLAGPIRDALLGEPNAARHVLDIVVAYEQGDWEKTDALTRDAGMDETIVPKAYAEALRWAREVSRSTVY